MSKIKVIKTEQDYSEALEMIEELMSYDPDPNSEEGEQISLLSMLIQDYESKTIPGTPPDPIEAIKFRMEQADLKPADLIPYIGSRSRVSEILSGKRKLTLEMVRALEIGLGIPAKVLIKEYEQDSELQYSHWDTSLVRVMSKRGYFGDISSKKSDKVELLKYYFSTLEPQIQPAVLLRRANYRSPRTDKNALSAWLVRILQKAKTIKAPTKYKHGVINLDFMQNFVKLSVKEDGPLLAKDCLMEHGIKLVIEPHLPKTKLDGAAILKEEDNPVIGLTLRYDRLDNFWFTLMHELSHIALHYNSDIELFYDELDDVKGFDIGAIEKEADLLASEALVPSDKWEISPAKLVPSSIAATSLAKELGVHVAIIAGKIRHEGGKWTYLNNIINQAKIRQHFPEEMWN